MVERIVLTHGCSLSNLPLFVAEGAGLFADEGLSVEVPVFSNLSSTAQILASGAADLGTMAFTQPLVDAYQPVRSVVVAGSGLMGIAILAQPPIRDVSGLRGRKVGTFRSDPLEVLLHDKLRTADMTFDDLEIEYLDDVEAAIQSFRDGKLAAITLAEPHGMRVRDMGAVELSDGTELWGNPFPDTVLVATEPFLTSKPQAVAAAIRAMLRAERVIVADPRGALEHVSKHYPGYARELLERGARRQPPCIDIRPFVPTIYGRWSSLQALALVPREVARPDVIALDLLEAELGRVVGPGIKVAYA